MNAQVEDIKRPRQWRMKQPIKDELRRQLEVAKAESAYWRGKCDDAIAELEGEGKCFAAGVLAGWLSVLLVWWIK